TITLLNNFDGPVGSSQQGPAILLTGTLENLGGTATITNVSGSIGESGNEYAKQVNLSAPKGNFVVTSTSPDPYNVAGTPIADWEKFMIWPGGDPATTLNGPDPNLAIAWVANYEYNQGGWFTNTQDFMRGFTSGGNVTQKGVIGFAGDKPSQGVN